MSRESNSEKYIICKNFKGYNIDIINILCHSFGRSLDIPIFKGLLDEIINVNNLYCNNQIKKIEEGIELIRTDIFNNLPSEKQIRLSYEWCNRYNIKINERCKFLKMNLPKLLTNWWQICFIILLGCSYKFFTPLKEYPPFITLSVLSLNSSILSLDIPQLLRA